MNNSAIFESVFKRDSNDISNLTFLKDLTEQHPYFSMAQFYLLQQTNTEDDGYKNQAAKTALHFNNPLWLNYLLTKVEAVEAPLQNNIAAVVENQKEIAEKELNNAEEVQVSDTTMLNSSTEATEPKEEKTIDIKPATLSAEQMLFEPMHMVDYFASQGIKLSEDMLKGDKLGKQLKSFTEWLKVMKKVHPEKLAESSVQTDISVQNMAEKSNTNSQIVTEAMAEVFAMQGKYTKAIEVYEKLSLINPAESAYFAAKILQLKG
jgi:tetratricopeptide (TPR) repeat protein